MTTPGIGPVTLQKVKKRRSLCRTTTRRYASGEIDWTGRISKCDDKMLRGYLYEAANVLLTRVAKWSALKAWAFGLQNEAGYAKPRLRLRESLRSFCIGCGSKVPNLDGQQRRPPCKQHSKLSNSRRPPAGSKVSAGTLALVRSPLALQCSKSKRAYKVSVTPQRFEICNSLRSPIQVFARLAWALRMPAASPRALCNSARP
jgi:hypothetical protein